MATYRFPRVLTLLAWENELRRSPLAWSEGIAGQPLQLDFSRVEYVDFGALARTLLLLDAAVKADNAITVSLPATTVFPTDEKTDGGPPLAQRRARARGDALVFMRQVGFLRSLRAPHWQRNPVLVLDGTAPAAQESGSTPALPESNPHNDPYQRRRVFPFRWLEPMPAAQLREAESFEAVAAGLEDLGLSRSDAQTLSQTVLTELVKNVSQHGSDDGQPPVALVGAILTTAETYGRRCSGMHGHMAEIADRAATDGSHVLRLIVADSGADLADRLASASERPGVSPVTDRGSRQDMVLNALGLRPASVEDASGRRRTTGLGWVARVVRSYHGGVEARTADLQAGLLFGREPEGTRVVAGPLGHIPGTLLELTLPTGPSPPPPLRLPTADGTVSAAAPRLQWMNCFFDPERGLADSDRARLSARISGAQREGPIDGLVITVPFQGSRRAGMDDRWRGAARQLLEYSTSIARGGLVVVAFPDAEPHVVGSCVAAFNEELDLADSDMREPVLVLDCRGEPAWCGGSPGLRAVLALLVRQGDGAEIATLAQCWQTAGGKPDGLLEALQAAPNLLDVGPSRATLRLSVAGALQALAEAAGQRVAAAINSAEDGVELGTFRGPTLHLTDRWISVGRLLEATTGTSLTAFVLARKMEATLRSSGSTDMPTVVVQAGAAIRPLARHLSECLSLGGRFYSQQSDLNFSQPPLSEQVPSGQRVVLCTDLIRTESTVRRAVRMIAGRGANPMVIVCVVDAREKRGPVRLLNRTVPVVSLSDADISQQSPVPGAVIDIDPLMLQPVRPAPAVSAAAGEVDLLNWCENGPDVLRLGHIDEQDRRHYTAFFRPQAMRQQSGQDQITEAVLASVRRAFADIQARTGADMTAGSPLAIWYVPSDGNAETLAETIRGRLTTDGFAVEAAVTPIPRQMAGDAWAFPATLADRTEQRGVLLVHWWSITGSTLLHLVRLAARSGARWIAAVCVLNQMDDANDAEVLRMLHDVAIPPASSASGDGVPIPVSIRFVANGRITAFSHHDCPICATRERYQVSEDAAPPRLVAHAKLIQDMLRPRELDEVARDSAADLFAVPVTGRQATDYLRWRGLLVQARRTVRDRHEVLMRLSDLTSIYPPPDKWTSVGLIRLLAAEPSWLRLPPLYFEAATGLLAEICLKSFEQLTAPLWLRVQALIVMSAAVPEQLIELLPRLLASAGNEAVLADQMLLDCCRLLLPASDNSPVDIARLRRNLLECRSYLEGQHAKAAEDHLHAVRSLLVIADFRILSRPQGLQAAWERLSEGLARPVVRHGLEGGLLLVRTFVEDIERFEPTPESALAAETDWDRCARQLEERALANLPPLRPVLAGELVSDWLGHKDQNRLLTLARPDVGELRAVTDRLHALARGPWRPGDPSWRKTRRELLDRINWWNRMFLAAHLADLPIPALLVELIRSAPISPGPYLAKLLQAHTGRAVEQGTEFRNRKVFCPEKLMEDIVGHLLDNLDKHQTDGAIRRVEITYHQPDEDVMRVTVRNSGTMARTPRGNGLKALNVKLEPFGGSLRGQELTEGAWTFAVEVKLPLWHGG